MILDLMLPGRDGADVLAEVREARPQLPVIVLTARTEIRQQGRGARPGRHRLRHQAVLVRGAHGARVRAHLRDRDEASSTRLELGDLRMDLVGRRVERAGVQIRLTTTEFDLLAFFMRHPGQVLTRSELLRAVWGYPDDVDSGVVGRLRRIPAAKARRRRGTRADRDDQVGGVSPSGRCLSARAQAPRDGHPHPAHDRDRGHRPRGPGGHVLRRLPAHRLRPSRPGRSRPERGRRRARSARWNTLTEASRRRDLPARAALHQLAADLRAVFGALRREGRRRPPRDQRARAPGRRARSPARTSSRGERGGAPVAGDPRGPRRLLDDRTRRGRERPAAHPAAVHRRSRGGPDHGRAAAVIRRGRPVGRGPGLPRGRLRRARWRR